jgi:hypothetical protein
VVDQSIDGRCRGYRVLEDPFPTRRGEIACQYGFSALVSVGQDRKQHFRLLPIELDMADVIDDQRLVLAQVLQEARQFQITFGDQQVLHQ